MTRSLASLLLFVVAGLTACRPAPTTTTPSADPPLPAGTTGLVIHTPHAGDTLVEGRSYTVRWRTPAGIRINLGSVMGGKDKGLLLTGVLGIDSLQWTVPVGFVSGFGISASNQVRLRLENADSTAQWVEVGPLTVVAQP